MWQEPLTKEDCPKTIDDSLIGVHVAVTALLEYFNDKFNELKSGLTGPRALSQSPVTILLFVSQNQVFIYY